MLSRTKKLPLLQSTTPSTFQLNNGLLPGNVLSHYRSNISLAHDGVTIIHHSSEELFDNDIENSDDEHSYCATSARDIDEYRGQNAVFSILYLLLLCSIVNSRFSFSSSSEAESNVDCHSHSDHLHSARHVRRHYGECPATPLVLRREDCKECLEKSNAKTLFIVQRCHWCTDRTSTTKCQPLQRRAHLHLRATRCAV